MVLCDYIQGGGAGGGIYRGGSVDAEDDDAGRRSNDGDNADRNQRRRNLSDRASNEVRRYVNFIHFIVEAISEARLFTDFCFPKITAIFRDLLALVAETKLRMSNRNLENLII